jgi:hypothetical protein
MKSPWSEFKFDIPVCRRYQIGPLKMWIQGDDRKWMVSYIHKPEEKNCLELGIEEEKPDDVQWTQMIISKPSNSLRFLPIMPDRPVVVRLRNPTKVKKNGECVLFVFIPVWVRICIGSDASGGIQDLPSVMLSNTWFGDTISGELCYSLKIPSELALVIPSLGPHRVICPVRIRNCSDGDLLLERLCVHVDNLNIYRGAEGNWANEVDAEYNGEDQTCSISYKEEPPGFDKIESLLMVAREPVSTSLMQRTIGNLRAISF